MQAPKRSVRRHHEGRMKAKAAALWLMWNCRPRAWGMIRKVYWENGRKIQVPYTAKELQAQIGILASTHGRSCSCWMCDVHKQPASPHRERLGCRRIWDV